MEIPSEALHDSSQRIRRGSTGQISPEENVEGILSYTSQNSQE
jgi:hypothetical protein